MSCIHLFFRADLLFFFDMAAPGQRTLCRPAAKQRVQSSPGCDTRYLRNSLDL